MHPHNLLECPKWTAIYRGGRNGDTAEIVVNSIDEPEPERIFRFPGVGRLKYKAVSITKLTQPTGGSKMGKVVTRKKGKKTKAEEPEDELEGLEGLDDDLEGLDEEEPETEEDDSEDEDDEEPEEKPKAKKGKAKGKKGKQAPPVRELPKGKVGVERVAELAGVDGRAVRIFLRKREIATTDGRYAFTEAQAKKIAASIKKSRKD